MLAPRRTQNALSNVFVGGGGASLRTPSDRPATIHRMLAVRRHQYAAWADWDRRHAELSRQARL